MSAAVVAIIFAAVYDMAAKVLTDHKSVNLAIMIASFVLSQFFGINIIWIILGGIAAGLVRTIVTWQKGEKE